LIEYCIGSKHSSKFWYEYRIYINLIEELEKLGFKYQSNSKNRIYFLGWPLSASYKEIGPIDKSANNIALSFSHADRYSNIELFNKFYVFSQGMQKFFHQKTGVNYEILRPFSSLTTNETEDERYRCDIAFVGNIRTRQIVEDVLPVVEKLNLDFKIFGYDWTHYRGNPRAIKFWQGDVIPYKDIPLMSHNAKIVLVDHHESMNIMGCVSHKYVDLLASGAFVISDSNNDASTYNGIIYKNKEQLYELITRYLNDEKARLHQKSKQNTIVKSQTTESAAQTISRNFK